MRRPPCRWSREGVVKRFGSFTSVDGIALVPGKRSALDPRRRKSDHAMIGCVSPSPRQSSVSPRPGRRWSLIRARLGSVPQEATPISSSRCWKHDPNALLRPPPPASSASAPPLRGSSTHDRRNDPLDPVGGMKRRLTVARSLINHRSVLPTADDRLDPQARTCCGAAYQLKRSGVTWFSPRIHGRGRAAWTGW